MFLDEKGKVIYVGKANSIRKRVSSYFLSKDLGPKTTLLVSKIRSIKTVSVDSEIEAFLLEAYLIKKYKPVYNSRLTDGKSYPYVLIDTLKNYPKVLIIRRPDSKKTILGPFPNASDLRNVLKLIRRIFPYQSVVNHPKKKCLYNHLGLCPCPPLLSDSQLRTYRKNIFHISKFLKGNTRGLIKDLEKERDKKSKIEDFEGALDLQRKIEKIKSITTGFTHPVNYDFNPNLREDQSFKSTQELTKVLIDHNVGVLDLNKIECYDISNTSGSYSTGSMVVFIKGERDTALYRRFRIKNPPKVIPNDFAMLREVLERRIKRDDWELPSLIVVDGGKGQVSTAVSVLDESNIQIPVIGLAKREETVITSDFKEIRLDRKSLAFKLITGIRNEAHRFAITYHQKLRSRMVFER
jgi:excinuclease ABC subunit C